MVPLLGAGQFKRVESATALIWKLLLVAEKRFRRLDAPHLLKDVFEGRKFEDGKPVSTQQRTRAFANVLAAGNKAVSKYDAPGHVRGAGLLTDGFELHPLGADLRFMSSLPFGATLRGSPAGAGEGVRPFDPP